MVYCARIDCARSLPYNSGLRFSSASTAPAVFLLCSQLFLHSAHNMQACFSFSFTVRCFLPNLTFIKLTQPFILKLHFVSGIPTLKPYNQPSSHQMIAFYFPITATSVCLQDLVKQRLNVYCSTAMKMTLTSFIKVKKQVPSTTHLEDKVEVWGPGNAMHRYFRGRVY